MKCSISLCIGLFIASAQLALANENSSGTVFCPKEAGLIQGPYVPTVDVARQIFRAVARAIEPPVHFAKYPFVVVYDNGDKWIVGQHRTDPGARRIHKLEPYFVEVEGGGGGLYMSIDKCTGVISEVAYSR